MALGPLGNNMNPLASFRQTTEQVRRIMDPMREYRRAMEATKPVELLGTRRIMDQAAGLAMNPTAEHMRMMERTKPANPLASYSEAMEQVGKVMDPMREYRRAMEATKPVDFLGSRVTDQARLAMNPTAEARRALELANPLASHSQTMEQVRRIMDPMGEYRRIVQNFSGLVGIDPASIAVEGLDDGDGPTPETAPSWLAQNPALVVTLLSIAWCCGWLLAKGADVERVGGLLLAALGLAAYLAEKQSDERS